jgi:alkylhydroperoxidase/carboxymuconolactone decarboxylase family protein YurZ
LNSRELLPLVAFTDILSGLVINVNITVMANNYPPFIAALENSDPVLFKAVAALYDAAMTPGELDAKTKILIALAIDAFEGSTEGVRSLSGAAKKMGMTDGQINEALRIAYMISGNKTLVCISAGR